MERNNLQPNNSYSASFAPNFWPNMGQQQGAQPEGRPVPPLGHVLDLSHNPAARNLQACNFIRPIEEAMGHLAPDNWNLPEYQPIQPGEPYMEKLADEAANTKRMERFLKHAQDCEADGYFEDAEKAYADVLKHTENAEHYKLYAGCLQKASASLQDTTKANLYREKAARAFYYLGDLYQKQTAWREAQAASKVSCDLALYEAPLKALVDVARHLEEATELAVALEKLADFYAEKGAIALAIDKLNEAFEVGKVARVLEKLEALYSGEGNPSKMHELAIQRFELQISQDPKNIGLYRDYAWFLKDIGKRNEARAVKKRIDELLQQKLVKQKKQIEFLNRQVIHLNFSHWPAIQDADLISFLKKNRCLQSLNLEGCEHLTDAVLRILPERFENLQELNLTRCRGVTASGLDAIAENATQLKRMVLDYCPGTTIRLLHKLNAKGIAFTIEGVVFEKNPLKLVERKDDLTDEDLLKALQENPEITELILDDCTKITDAGLAPLKNFQWLTYLNLFRCKQITDAGLGHLVGLTQLTHLNLNWCHQITDRGLQYLSGLTNLTDLGSHDFHQVTDSGLQYLAGLTQLKSLILHNFQRLLMRACGTLILHASLSSMPYPCITVSR